MSGNPSLSVVVPVYNEEKILTKNVQKLRSLLGNPNVSYEVIICDDYSSDGTRKEALSLSKEDSRITYLRFNRRIGKGGTIKNALRVARGRAVMIMDADVPVFHQDLRKVLKQVEMGGKLVVAVRRSRPNTSVLRMVLSTAYNVLVRLLFRTDITDHQCGLKVLATDFATETLPKIRSDGFLFDTELIVYTKRMKVPIRIVPIDWVENRPWGTSKVIPLRAVLTLAVDLAILRISQIMGRKLLMYKEVVAGEFTNNRSSRAHEATRLMINVKGQKLLEALRKVYLMVAFGKGR